MQPEVKTQPNCHNKLLLVIMKQQRNKGVKQREKESEGEERVGDRGELEREKD